MAEFPAATRGTQVVGRQDLEGYGSGLYYYPRHITNSQFIFDVDLTFEERIQVLRESCLNQPQPFSGSWQDFPG